MLTTFWIRSSSSHAPLGFGVTARSLEDALQIIRAFGYGDFLPADRHGLEVVQPMTISALDQNHVAPNMGPTNVRGLWYPFVAVGIPRWAEERMQGCS